MHRTILRLATALLLTSTALSVVPLAAAQDPGPTVGNAIGTVTDTGRYAIEIAAGAGGTALDAIDGLTPTVVGLVNSLGNRIGDLVAQARELLDLVDGILDSLLCNVRDLVTNC